MHSRALRIAILLFQAFWLNVVVPGHTRGIVALPGEQCTACEFDSRLALVPSCCPNRGRQGTERRHSIPPIRDPAQHCAICHFAARLSVPVAVNFTLPPLGLAGVVPPPQAQDIIRAVFLATYDGRGPPPAPSA